MANDLFDIVNSITNDKKDFKDLPKYNAYVVNRFLMQNKKCIFAVNEMNKRYWLSDEMQYEFLKNIIPKHRSFDKHTKKDKEDNKIIENISYYFSVNLRRAESFFKDLTDKQIDSIQNKVEKGIRECDAEMDIW